MFKAEPLKQDWNSHLPRYWNDQSPFKTHFLNALSIVLPDCEKFFIKTINLYAKDSDNYLELKEFIKQESYHSLAHKKYNNWLASQGLPVNRLQNSLRRIWKLIDKYLGKKSKLAITMSVEHITVVYAYVLLQHRHLLNQMHPHFERIWRWHAIEEIEHKSVAANIWYANKGTNIHKNSIMLFVLLVYIWYIGKNTIIFLHEDKQLWKLQTWKDMVYFLFNKDHGLLRKSFIPWFEFMEKDFHPNDQSHDHLLLQYAKL